MKTRDHTSRGYKVQISELISTLQKTHADFGDTCIYIRGSVSWGAVALNRHDEDTKLDIADASKTFDGAPEKAPSRGE